jgi:hypothetical protein
MSDTPLSIHVGETAELTLPYSEACIHLRVAGKVMKAKLLTESAVQLLSIDGSNYSFPITTGEAGIYRTEGPDGPHFYHY